MNRDDMANDYQKIFGQPPNNIFFSPGRINLIGEHTDYNGGKVFPCAISLGTYAHVSLRDDLLVAAYSANFPEDGVITFSLDYLDYEREHHWANYLKGMLFYLQEKFGNFDRGFNIHIYGNIPSGASLSSSASLEVLTGMVAKELYQLNISRTDIALMGMRVENEYLSLKSGIMDQFIIAHGRQNHALLLNTSDLAFEAIPLNFRNYQIVIMNSLTRRELVDSEYNMRRQECEEALYRLQSELDIDNLCALNEQQFESFRYLIADKKLERRARHVIYENKRTERAVKALKNNKLKEFGQLMNESHRSLHKDYEVTVEETNLLVELAWEHPGVIGARMTGGGFGGCCIAIVEEKQIDSFKNHVGQLFEKKIGHPAEFYIVQTADGARKIG